MFLTTPRMNTSLKRKEPISIWFLIPSLGMGGAERTLVDLANGVSSNGFNVTVWSIIDEGDLREELDSSVTYRTIDANHKSDIRAVLAYLRVVRKENPDIIQSFTFFDNQLVRLSKFVSRDTKVITGVRTVIDDEPRQRELLDSITLRLSDRIVSNSQAGAEHIIDRGADPDSVEVIRNGRDIETYVNGSASPDLYDSLSIDPDCPIVGTVGRLVERKGHYDLLEAWPKVKQEFSEIYLLIVGDGPERDGLEARAEELNCANSVRFAGQRDDVPDLLDAMDVFVFPSHYEGLPGALLEAMIAGLPIVATPVDGNSELIEDRVTGLFFPPHDSEVLADRLVELLADPERQQMLGLAANDYAQQEFTVESMVSDFSSLYNDIKSNKVN
jgi:glycosyltransferase involved in cell wall biosynthesis